MSELRTLLFEKGQGWLRWGRVDGAAPRSAVEQHNAAMIDAFVDAMPAERVVVESVWGVLATDPSPGSEGSAETATSSGESVPRCEVCGRVKVLQPPAYWYCPNEGTVTHIRMASVDGAAPPEPECVTCRGSGGDPASITDDDPTSDFYGQPTSPCPDCNGTGRAAPPEPERCPECWTTSRNHPRWARGAPCDNGWHTPASSTPTEVERLREAARRLLDAPPGTDEYRLRYEELDAIVPDSLRYRPIDRPISAVAERLLRAALDPTITHEEACGFLHQARLAALSGQQDTERTEP